MKKILMFVACAVMAFALVACGSEEYKFGMGVVTSLESSKTGTAQAQ